MSTSWESLQERSGLKEALADNNEKTYLGPNVSSITSSHYCIEPAALTSVHFGRRVLPGARPL